MIPGLSWSDNPKSIMTPASTGAAMQSVSRPVKVKILSFIKRSSKGDWIIAYLYHIHSKHLELSEKFLALLTLHAPHT